MDYKINRLSDYSDDSLLNELKRVAKLIGKDILTQKDFSQHSKTNHSTIVKRFGSWNSALERAGLHVGRKANISTEDLFSEIEKVWNRLGRRPQYREMERFGKFSLKPYENRFGSWIKAVEKFVKWKEDKRPIVEKELNTISPEILIDTVKERKKVKKVEYGEPIDFLGLRHAPLNEQGVVYLFSILSRKLGFIIEAVRTDFPDCEGKREIPGKPGRWERVSIEFEFKSSHFKDHDHNPDECDVIVSWENDWKDCPIEVISLKEIMLKAKK
ncbi:MAG: hypothetical protein E3K36_08235 [Candidatus Brocadia sp.]|nr:hypothetical protein [Candidatus Brocadia sp.]